MPPGLALVEDPPAISLLMNVPALESQLFAKLAQLNQVSGLKPLAWEEIGPRVYLPRWQRVAQENASYLPGVTPALYAEIAQNLTEFARKFPANSLAERRSQADSLLGIALAVALHTQGWKLHTAFHEQPYFQQDDLELCPFSVIEDLAQDKVSPADWQHQCDAAGISDLDLAQVCMASAVCK